MVSKKSGIVPRVVPTNLGSGAHTNVEGGALIEGVVPTKVGVLRIEARRGSAE